MERRYLATPLSRSLVWRSPDNLPRHKHHTVRILGSENIGSFPLIAAIDAAPRAVGAHTALATGLDRDGAGGRVRCLDWSDYRLDRR